MKRKEPYASHPPHRHESEQVMIVVDGEQDEIVEGKLYHLFSATKRPCGEAKKGLVFLGCCPCNCGAEEGWMFKADL